MAILGGVGFFLGEYAAFGRRWAMAAGNPHGDKGIIVDADGRLLRDLTNDVYNSEEALRRATVHWVGDDQGRVQTAVLDHYKDKMNGYHPVTGLYAFGQSVMELTLRAGVQLAAREALGDHRGTIAVYNYETGEILCAVSTPDFDPKDTGEAVHGQYLNRFLQGRYTPGSIFKVVTAGAALEYLPDILQRRFVCSGTVSYGDAAVTCAKPHGEMDLYGAMAQSCNCAFAQIAQQLGSQRLESFMKQCGVINSITVDGVQSAEGKAELENGGVGLAWAAIGQHEDLVNPARFLAFMGAIARDGRGIKPRIVEKIFRDGKTVYGAQREEDVPAMSHEVAKQLQKILRNNVKSKYGDQHFPGLAVCAKTGTAQVGADKPNAMLAGFVSDPALPLAFFIAVEEGGSAERVCIPIAKEVLASCREEIKKDNIYAPSA